MADVRPLLAVRDLSFSYDGHGEAVHQFSFAVGAGEIAVLMGPSGSGKSTLLRLVAGLEHPSGGVIESGHLPPSGMFLAFQDYDALPWLTVAQNVKIVRRFARLSSDLPDWDRVLSIVGLSDYVHLYPRQLSGGMRKRLALARVLASGARIVLLDEPFASLDTSSRISLQLLVQQVVQNTSCAVVLVTHDLEEAVFLGTRVFVCSGPPLQLEGTLDISWPLARSPSLLLTDDFEAVVMALRKMMVMPQA